MKNYCSYTSSQDLEKLNSQDQISSTIKINSFSDDNQTFHHMSKNKQRMNTSEEKGIGIVND